jgi:hypothetical protein
MAELAGTLGRVLEFCTARMAPLFLGPPSLNMARLAETACFVLAHLAAPGNAVATGILALKLPSSSSSSRASQSLNRATLLAPVLGRVNNPTAHIHPGSCCNQAAYLPVLTESLTLAAESSTDHSVQMLLQACC